MSQPDSRNYGVCPNGHGDEKGIIAAEVSADKRPYPNCPICGSRLEHADECLDDHPWCVGPDGPTVDAAWGGKCSTCYTTDPESMTDDHPPDATLEQFDIGDEIVVSARSTPMEIVELPDTDQWDNRRATVVAENHYGRYRIIETDDGTLNFSVSSNSYFGSTWSPEESDVEVDYAE